MRATDTGFTNTKTDRRGGDQKSSCRQDIWKQEYLDGKQESGEDTREYYAANEESWFQAYAPRGAWLNFRMKCLGTVRCRVKGNMPVYYV